MSLWHNVPFIATIECMTTAQQILIGYATIALSAGFLLGVILGAVRSKQSSARNLATAHVETLLQGAVLLGVAFALGLTDFDGRLATWGATLLAIGSAMQAVGVTLNWITGTVDQFAERSPGFLLNSASTFAAVPGLAILAYGILSAVISQ